LPDEDAYLQQWVAQADKVVFLISPHSLAYPYYPLAEQAAAADKLIPIKLVEVDLSGSVFEQLSTLPSDNRFVSQWSKPNSAYVDIAQQLRRYFQKLAHG
ncbi:MAG: hypothetical protein D6772_13395, partial [Bacteroidetes bacterium]